MARQSELNSKLDLDKGDQQGADAAPEISEELDKEKPLPGVTSDPNKIARMAESYLRAAGTSIREMPIIQRAAPTGGPVTGRAVAKDEEHVALATAANRFIVVEAAALGREVRVGERLSLLFSQGRPAIDDDHSRGR